MTAFIARASTGREIAETLALAVIGGGLFGLIGVPAGYLSGSIVVVAAAALAGRPMRLPLVATRAIYLLIGISLGAVVTPETLHGMATYPLSIAVLIVAMACIGVAGATYLRAVHGWEKTSAYLAAAPGGMSQVLVLASELGADLRAVAIVQTMRVVIVAVGLPAGLALFGLVGHAVRRSNGAPTWALFGELAIMVVASALGAAFAHRFRLPGGLMFGAMIVSAVLHGSGLVHAVVPAWVANAAAIALGAVIGSRFTNTPLRLLLDYITAAFGSFAVAVAIAAVFAAGLLELLPVHASEVMIAFAPGSVDAMMLLALALHLDPVYVGAHHVVRIFFVGITMPFVARRVAQAHQPPQVTFED
ncbi:MAG TPA: AbrB family transcriptional regulator [Xanthobacteraceae bacterium]|nr:AbrB family transcriptional regulator [Xanthobacteraceae bacterium]